MLITAGWYFGEYAPYNKTIVTIYDTKLKERDLIDTMEYYAAMYAAYGQTIDLTQQADYIMSSMVQNELLRRGAEQLGVTISDEEIDKALGDNAKTAPHAVRELVRGSLLQEKLKSDYFGQEIGDTGTQVLMNAMMVESEDIIPQIKEQLLSGGNFSMLAEKYAVNTVSKNNKGVFPWHPQSVLKTDLGSTIAVNWAFSDNVSAGQISDALSDNVSSKQLGYWLLKVKGKQGSDNATVDALLVANEAQAKYVRSLLVATDNISGIAAKYSQYSPSKQSGGVLGEVAASENISTAFNDYVFSDNATIGVWSEPVKDTHFWTTGGAWIVQVVDKSNDRPYSVSDKDSLVGDAFEAWTNGLWSSSTTDIAYLFSDAQKQWAIDRANKKIAELAGG